MNMHRVDIIRWALTGGKPGDPPGTTQITCPDASPTTTSNPDPNYCDPELYNQTGNSSKVGAVCNDTLAINDTGTELGGCILKTDSGLEVKVPWSRVNDGLASQFKALPVQPRLGAMVFSDTGIWKPKVYLGDFLSSNNNSVQFPYQNFIALINSVAPTGGTPTGLAMWDALNYFAMNPPLYGGFPAQSGTGDRWKNPLYICDGQGGNNCVLNTCARNFVLLMSDGDWNSPTTYIDNNPDCSENGIGNHYSDPVVPAYCMHEGVQNLMGGGTPVSTKVNGVYTVGLFMGSDTCGTDALENVAMYGSFDNSVNTWPSGVSVLSNLTTGYPPASPTCTCPPPPATMGATSSGSLCAAVPTTSSTSLHPDWDTDSNGIPDTFYSGSSAMSIKQSILDAVMDMLSHVTSGTAASVLASGQGRGANLIQATYYPRRKFFDNAVNWVGGLQNLWYYIDPTFVNSGIREDDGDKILELLADPYAAHQDYITNFYYDTSAQKAKADLYTSLSTGATGTWNATVDFEQLNNLWEAGVLLWNRAASDRTIYTPIGTTQLATDPADVFSAGPTPLPDNTATLRPLLNTDDPSASAADNNTLAQNVINYVRGVDIADFIYTSGTTSVTKTYRPRTVKIDLNNDNNATDTSVLVDNIAMDETAPKVWKLGDIIDSTPMIASWVPLNNYDTKWDDASYKAFYNSTQYATRGMVYVGANDGMLHAFKLGLLQYSWTGQQKPDQVAELQCADGTTTCADYGKEMWAFIPKNVLPYLKYLKDTSYCHINSVDLTPFLVDASIGVPAGCAGDYWTCAKDATTWRTILIGGMRLGGACADTASTCTTCVKTPVSGNGYSAYFALDVTNENQPQFLWEFSDPGLGFSTSGPAVIRIGSRTAAGTTSSLDSNTNGRWFVVFGSGPTGPIDATSQKFQGNSDQDLKIYILDLKTGQPATPAIDTKISNAFAGSMVYSMFDNYPNAGMDYQDRALYIPYVKLCAAGSTYCTANTWTDGGVLRLLTNQDLNDPNVSATGGTALNPANWKWGYVMDGIGPVTSAVTNILDSNNLWLYFGTGRYYYRSSAGSDDPTTGRNLFGVTEPCFANGKYSNACLTAANGDTSDMRTIGQLSSVDTTTCAGVSNSYGWYVDLDSAGTYTYDNVSNYYNAERVITDPTAAPSLYSVLFTTTKPYSDLCAVGGKTFMWDLKYDTGGCASQYLNGTALVQVSTGAIEQVNLSTAFTDKGGRRTTAMEGLPPTAQGLNLMNPPDPAQKVFHKEER